MSNTSNIPVPRIWYSLVVLAAASLTGAYVCRTLAGGIGQERLLESAGKGVTALPTTFGSWRMVKSEPLADTALAMLNCRAHESRVYVDDQTGDSISLILMAGVAGPIVAHTPETCYSSTDYDIDESAKTLVVRQTDDRADTFGRVVFRSKSLTGQKQEVFYAWRKHDGPWEAPQSPRLALGGQPMLYKLQLSIASPANTTDKTYATDSMNRFLADLLPVLDQILTSG